MHAGRSGECSREGRRGSARTPGRMKDSRVAVSHRTNRCSAVPEEQHAGVVILPRLDDREHLPRRSGSAESPSSSAGTRRRGCSRFRSCRCSRRRTGPCARRRERTPSRGGPPLVHLEARGHGCPETARAAPGRRRSAWIVPRWTDEACAQSPRGAATWTGRSKSPTVRRASTGSWRPRARVDEVDGRVVAGFTTQTVTAPLIPRARARDRAIPIGTVVGRARTRNPLASTRQRRCSRRRELAAQRPSRLQQEPQNVTVISARRRPRSACTRARSRPRAGSAGRPSR